MPTSESALDLAESALELNESALDRSVSPSREASLDIDEEGLSTEGSKASVEVDEMGSAACYFVLGMRTDANRKHSTHKKISDYGGCQ